VRTQWEAGRNRQAEAAPDWAWAMTSRPLIIGTIARCWIADGFSRPGQGSAVEQTPGAVIQRPTARLHEMPGPWWHAGAWCGGGKAAGGCDSSGSDLLPASLWMATCCRFAANRDGLAGGVRTVCIQPAQQVFPETHGIEGVQDLDLLAGLELQLAVRLLVHGDLLLAGCPRQRSPHQVTRAKVCCTVAMGNFASKYLFL
jgi:hypothetical protein